MYGGVKFFEIDPEDTTREKILPSITWEKTTFLPQLNLLLIMVVGEFN